MLTTYKDGCYNEMCVHIDDPIELAPRQIYMEGLNRCLSLSYCAIFDYLVMDDIR